MGLGLPQTHVIIKTFRRNNSMVKGKKPTAEQRKVLIRNSYNPEEWLYMSQVVRGDTGNKRLAKDELKTTYLVFRNRTTDQRIELAV